MRDEYKTEPDKRIAYMRGHVHGEQNALGLIDNGVPKLLILMANIIADGLLSDIEHGRRKTN